MKPGDFSVTFGDTSVIKFVSESVKHHDSLYYHRHPIDGYVPGTSFDSGNALRWFSEHVLNLPVERALELARSVTPGEENQVYLPGDRGLFHDPDIGISILGLDYDHSMPTDQVQGRLARGLALSIILAEWGYISLIEDHFDTHIDNIRVMNTGGLNLENHEWWNQLRASVWDRQVTEMDARMTAGLLIPATLITSLYDTPAEATDALLRQQSTIDPDPELADQYEQSKDGFFDRWKQVVSVYER
jgi:xylulokinase